MNKNFKRYRKCKQAEILKLKNMKTEKRQRVHQQTRGSRMQEEMSLKKKIQTSGQGSAGQSSRKKKG